MTACKDCGCPIETWTAPDGVNTCTGCRSCGVHRSTLVGVIRKAKRPSQMTSAGVEVELGNLSFSLAVDPQSPAETAMAAIAKDAALFLECMTKAEVPDASRKLVIGAFVDHKLRAAGLPLHTVDLEASEVTK